ncbi:hypothetical protein Tco_0820871 [Tanacetum coccineum]|uniref:Uncharacterized protein n=1 Tax=Tanacetum coccineum TaxID=301880 RepID=A0ABQ5ADA3_9ASTR
MLFGGKLIQKLCQKEVYEESFSRHAAWIGGKLIQFMHTTMVPVQVKTMKIQAGIQVSRPRELTRQLQLWKYALTENPTIYVSYIKQFWQTVTARTLDNGEIELTATIDGTVKTITEASVRRHL